MTRYLHVVKEPTTSNKEKEVVKTIEWSLSQEDGYLKLQAKGPDRVTRTVLNINPNVGLYLQHLPEKTDVAKSLPLVSGRILVTNSL